LATTNNYNFLIITHVSHSIIDGKYFAYGPYVREINLWIQHTKKIVIIAPFHRSVNENKIDLDYTHPNIIFYKVPAFQLTSFYEIMRALFCIPYILLVMFVGMLSATHIHLRCPGNMGLLGCIVQILFPFKKKTAKYAGNWDWKSNQPFTYKLQQRILRNTFLTHNIQTLVYGEWPDRNKNILPFFTASYSEKEKGIDSSHTIKKNGRIQLIFVGALAKGKNPLVCLTVASNLMQRNIPVEINFYGEGILRAALTKRITDMKMQDYAFLHGNVNSDTLKKAYQKSHFLLLLSDSEGWPKAVAEAMWWGCVPISTPVSCVPWMLNQEQRGLLVTNSNNPNLDPLISLILHPIDYLAMAGQAKLWAQEYSLERMNHEIQKLL